MMMPLHRRRGERGFTLIEILVVMVIMAVVIAFAAVSIGVTGRDRQLDEESRRVQGLMDLLRERSVLEGRDFGVLIEPANYRFVSYVDRRQRWENFDQDREFRRRSLPKGLSFELMLDSHNVVLAATGGGLGADSKQISPQIIVAASGEGTPFRLALLRTGTTAKATVVSDAMGKLTVENSDHVEKRP